MSFAATWVDLECHTNWSQSDRERETLYGIPYMCNLKKMIQMNLQNRKRLTDLEKELMVARGERWREGIVREYEMGMYTLLYLKWKTDKDLLYSTWNSAQFYVATWMAGEAGEEWMYVYVWLSPFAVHLKLSQHC